MVDRYLLRGLLWCGLCDESFAACLTSKGIRYYGCLSTRCPRPLVPAEEAEQFVWKGFVLRYEAVAGGLKRDQRQAALSEALERVTVHSGASDLDLSWRT
jgi:Recombinase zinc beta ribbon domain